MPVFYLAVAGAFCAANDLHWGWFTAICVAFLIDWVIDLAPAGDEPETGARA